MAHSNAQNAPESTQCARGVYHRLGIDGATTFEIVDSRGTTQFEVRVAECHCNDRTVRWLNTVLDAIDPPTQLKLA